MDRAVEICTGLSPWIRDQALTGSRAILSVTHPESDLDIAILAKSIHEYLQRIVPYLEVREWKADGSKPKPGTEFNLAPFHSWSKDKVNLIITESEDHFKRIVAATDLARRYCLSQEDLALLTDSKASMSLLRSILPPSLPPSIQYISPREIY